VLKEGWGELAETFLFISSVYGLSVRCSGMGKGV